MRLNMASIGGIMMGMKAMWMGMRFWDRQLPPARISSSTARRSPIRRDIFLPMMSARPVVAMAVAKVPSSR